MYKFKKVLQCVICARKVIFSEARMESAMIGQADHRIHSFG